MNINQVGIQSYQQVNRRDNQLPVTQDPAARPTNDATVVIEPQEGTSGSKLAVTAPKGSYADFLSVDEQKALELLFARFKDNQRFGTGYKATAAAEAPDPMVGQIIDVKV
ncbi:MAG: hypothetical protein AB1644_02255 [Candidatus Zixiibacteriota bacterium]